MTTAPITVLQLNVEGISAAKRELILKLAKDNHANVLLLQETHTTEDKQLSLEGFSLVSYNHHRQHGLATYVSHSIDASELCSGDHWNAIQVGDFTIVNVYKPPSEEWLTPPLPLFHNDTLDAGDFNSPHTS